MSSPAGSDNRPLKVSRRTVLGYCGSALAAPFIMHRAAAQASDGSPWWYPIDEARALIGNTDPNPDGLTIGMPSISGDGASVPFSMSVEAAIAPERYVESLHCFATAHRRPAIAEFYLSPRCGRAEIATQIRSDDSQIIGAIARFNTGEVLVAEHWIEVVVTGCLLDASTYATSIETMRARVRADPIAAPDRPVEVTTMITHPMESGYRLDAEGFFVPRNLIERFVASYNRATVIEARLHEAIAANPYLRFFVLPGDEGELSFRWEEDTGRVTTETLAVRA